jgi:DNA replication and repair protein RecF
MLITTLEITDFRNVQTATLHPASIGCNIIYGNNGSGKTSLLEAIHCLSLGRSFRGSTPLQIIRHEADQFTLFSELLNETQRSLSVGLSRDRKGGLRWRLDKKEINISTDIVSLIPVLLMNAHSHHLLELGPNGRRKFLDRGLFYQFDHFMDYYKNFCRAIKQRNIALRASSRAYQPGLDSWTAVLIQQAQLMTALREQYIRIFAPFLKAVVYELLQINDFTIQYEPGWDADREYSQVLEDCLSSDREAGYTQYGPHRADFKMTIKGRSAKHCLSRGQQKLLVSALLLAQGQLLAREKERRALYLIDDLPSELDKYSRQRILTLLARQQAQVFVTAIEKETIQECVDPSISMLLKMFHVEHGIVCETG